MPLDTASFGFPVELPHISKQLKKLWENEGHTKSRASILNFAVIGRGVETLESNTRLVSQLVREHACRAFVVGVSAGTEPKISAWIQAHCHLTKAGARQICSEQVTLLAEGCSEDAYAHALLANLDYDLPLTLWWQGELPEFPHSALWQTVNRLIFDSREWLDFPAQLTSLHRTKQTNAQGVIWADLNWTRSLALRQALAQCFDAPDCLPHLHSVTALRIRHSPESRSTSVLFAGWLASHLGWKPTGGSQSELTFHTPSGGILRCILESAEGAAISGLYIDCPDLNLRIESSPASTLLHALIRAEGHPERESSFPGGPSESLGLLAAEMIPGGSHVTYPKALSIVQAIPQRSLFEH